MSVLRAGVFSKWGCFGAVLGRLGGSWGRLGPSWSRLGAVLGLSWGRLGGLWAVLGQLLGPKVDSIKVNRDFVSHSGSIWASFGARFGGFSLPKSI